VFDLFEEIRYTKIKTTWPKRTKCNGHNIQCLSTRATTSLADVDPPCTEEESKVVMPMSSNNTQHFYTGY